MIHAQANGLSLWRFESLSQFERLQHGVTGRSGGVSGPPYAALNLGLHVGDDPAAVIENRRRLGAALGADFDRLTFCAQVHGAELAVVGEERIGAGRLELTDAIQHADGLIVTQPGVLAVVLSADCVPLLLYDPERHVGAAVHAGWRGTAAGMARRAVRLLQEQCGCAPEDLRVGLAPSIGPCCYQVSREVAEQIATTLPYSEPVTVARAGAWYADLPAANRQQLLAAGVRDEHIEASGICTSCRAEEFFSERKLGRPTGRLGALIALR